MADEARPTIWKRLAEIQATLKVEKGQWNSFSKFHYRSKEDILEAAKPLCHERGLLLICDDEVMDVNGWKYVRSEAMVVDVETGECAKAVGLAREPQDKKGMDASQITGTASSYAGKRALGNLFAIDDTKDADTMQPTATQATKKEPPETGSFVARCQSCGTAYTFPGAAQFEAFKASATCCPNPRWEVA